MDQGVPVYRFTQYVGDIVWINPGTVHWVQANVRTTYSEYTKIIYMCIIADTSRMTTNVHVHVDRKVHVHVDCKVHVHVDRKVHVHVLLNYHVKQSTCTFM